MLILLCSAWAGKIEWYKQGQPDDLHPMVPTQGSSGTGDWGTGGGSQPFVVDGNGNGGYLGLLTCLNGGSCKLYSGASCNGNASAFVEKCLANCTAPPTSCEDAIAMATRGCASTCSQIVLTQLFEGLGCSYNLCGRGGHNTSDFTTKEAMLAAGWTFNWEDENTFLTSASRRSMFCNRIPTSGYCGFKHPGVHCMLVINAFLCLPPHA